MKIIHKEQIEIIGEIQTFRVPCFSKIIKFALQNDEPTIWIEKPVGDGLDDSINVQIFGTGHAEIPHDALYIDTVIMGAFVWHLYRVFE